MSEGQREARLREGPLKYYGGKAAIAAKLIEHFPRRAKAYIEPFFGGGGVFFALPPELYPIEIINDLNRAVVTFYKVLRERPDALLERLKLTPYALDEQRACRDTSEDPLEDELETARRVWVRHRQNFGNRQASGVGWAWDHRVDMAQSTENKLSDLHAFADRMRTVQIHNMSALELIPRTAQEGTFYFCDPPYVQETRGSDGDYQHEMTEGEHRVLLAHLIKAVQDGAKVALSGYPSELYDKLLQGWRRVEFEANASSANFAEKEDRVRTEVLWMSYPEKEELRGWRPTKKVEARNRGEAALLRVLKRQGLSR